MHNWTIHQREGGRKRTAQHRKCCAPRKAEPQVLCQQESKKWPADGWMQMLYSHLKRARGIRSLLWKAWHKSVSEVAGMARTYGSMKATSATPKLWSWQLKSSLSTSGKWQARFTTLDKIPDVGCANNMQRPWHFISSCSMLWGIEYTERQRCGLKNVQGHMCWVQPWAQ